MQATTVPEEDFGTVITSVQGTVTAVEMVVKQGKFKFNVAFDFDPQTDTALMVAKELQDTHIAPQDTPMEDLIRDIELAIIARCRELTKGLQGVTASAVNVPPVPDATSS